MPEKIEIRAASRLDVPAIVALYRGGFAPAFVARTIFSASGIVNYLENIIDPPLANLYERLWVAANGPAILGFAHVRVLGDSLHLNNVVVGRKFQGRGIGARLFNEFTSWGDRLKVPRLTLDVEAENLKASNWYSRSGFATTGHQFFYEVSDPIHGEGEGQGDAAEISLDNWVEVQAWQRLYGFSNIRLQVGGKVYTVGRLGRKLFRLVDIPVGEIPALSRILKKIDAARKILLLRSSEIGADRRYEFLWITLRMTKRLGSG